jgi:hypothetical protein
METLFRKKNIAMWIAAKAMARRKESTNINKII